MILNGLDSLSSVRDALRSSGSKIVFTNGVFDILHAGHVMYLEHARSLGDILIVGVNSDDSVKRLKGESRPINALEDRMAVLAALRCVDYVVPFSEDTPIELIKTLVPNVLVKGGDYTRETIVGADIVEENGGRVVIVPVLENRSTTSIITRAQKA